MLMKFYPEDIQRQEKEISSLSTKLQTKEIETYYEFFNAETIAINDLSVEELMERIENYKKILFVERTKLQASMRGLNNRLKNLTDDERELLRLEDLEVSATTSPLTIKDKVFKKEKKKKDALSALEALGLDGNAILNLANKYGIGDKGKVLQDKRENAIVEKVKADAEDKASEPSTPKINVNDFLSKFK